MKPPVKAEETIQYLTAALSAMKQIKEVAMSRNKTTKFKAIVSLLTIIEARMDASLKYARAGGHSEFDASLQAQMYNPIIEWLAGEIA
jgi:hypothetical protein